MEAEPWKECLTCKDKCCKWNIAFPLFLTPWEKKTLIGIGSNHPCIFFNQKELCEIHKIRPIDCQFFPFDVHKVNGKFHWIIWKLTCPIVDKTNNEVYLDFFEKNIIPTFKQHLENYNLFRVDEMVSKFEFEILREIKLP